MGDLLTTGSILAAFLAGGVALLAAGARRGERRNDELVATYDILTLVVRARDDFDPPAQGGGEGAAQA